MGGMLDFLIDAIGGPRTVGASAVPPVAPPAPPALPAKVAPPKPPPAQQSDIELDREARKKAIVMNAIRKKDALYASVPEEKKSPGVQWLKDNIFPGQLPGDKPRLALGREAPEIASDD